MGKPGFCPYCGKALNAPATRKNPLPFILILSVYPGLYLLSWLFSSITLYRHTGTVSLPISFLLQSLAGLGIILYMVKKEKILIERFSYGDVLVWAAWDVVFRITTYLCDIFLVRYGGTASVGNTLARGAVAQVGLSIFFHYAVLLIFMLMRSQKIFLSRKIILLTGVLLLAWSLAMLLFKESIVSRYVDRSQGDLFITAIEYFSISALFLWIRRLVVLWFAVLLGQRKLSASGGIFFITATNIFIVVLSYVTMFILSMGMRAASLSESAGYVFGAAILLMFYIRSRQTPAVR